MNTKEIKKFLKETFGLNCLRVTSSLTKRPYFTARITPSVYARPVVGARNEYSEEFPLAFRQMALRVIYGDNCNFAEHGNAGNVRPHDIAMHETEWDKLVLGWNTEINKVGMLNPYLDTVPPSDKVTA